MSFFYLLLTFFITFLFTLLLMFLFGVIPDAIIGMRDNIDRIKQAWIYFKK